MCPGMLRRNYRSHSALLALPNRLFYSQGLLPAADQQQVSPGLSLRTGLDDPLCGHRFTAGQCRVLSRTAASFRLFHRAATPALSTAPVWEHP